MGQQRDGDSVQRHFRGFTLIELLVVVAIISLLAALLLPSLRGARERAKQMACLSNLRQVGFGIHMYCDDNRGWFPPMWG